MIFSIIIKPRNIKIMCTNFYNKESIYVVGGTDMLKTDSKKYSIGRNISIIKPKTYFQMFHSLEYFMFYLIYFYEMRWHCSTF